MYQFYLKNSAINGNVDTIFILHVTVKLTSNSDVALNKLTVGLWPLLRSYCISSSSSVFLAVSKRLMTL